MTRACLAAAFLFLDAAGLCIPGCAARTARVRTGLDVLEAEGFASLRGKRVGVVTNPTGVDARLRSLPELIARASGVKLAAVFGPEHGALGSAAAGAAVGDGRDPCLDVPVYSLYGKTRRPTREMLEGIDVLLFDIQDIGVRAYTYLATLTEVLAAAAESRVAVWVLDRPVPLGGETVEGPVLEAGRESFVGPHTVPLRHGLTAGEFALLVNGERRLGASLRVVRMDGWRRDAFFDSCGLLWVPPSPNIPTPETALIYAGMVLIEGTSLSEGRGTAFPFRFVGAPWLDADRLAAELNALRLPGCVFRPTAFTPTASKHRGESCAGVEVHVTDWKPYRSVTVAVALIQTVRRLHPDKFQLQNETFDRLAGTSALREAIEAGTPLEKIVDGWRSEVEGYLTRREPFLLYE